MKRVLTIAGSDSGGGAGLQADLKTFGALGVFGMSAVTSVTAQNTVGVTRVQDVTPEMVAAQIDAVMTDIGADAAKTGMLSNRAIVETVADAVKQHDIPNLVVDPVMVSKSGARLLHDDALEALRRKLLPLAAVVTPNLPEAAILAGCPVDDRRGVEEAARRIHDLGPRFVVIKGGHAEGALVVDSLFDGRHFEELRGERIQTTSSHGTGCTLSAAIAVYLALNVPFRQAAARAREYLVGALRSAPGLGRGAGPLDHFYARRSPRSD